MNPQTISTDLNEADRAADSIQFHAVRHLAEFDDVRVVPTAAGPRVFAARDRGAEVDVTWTVCCAANAEGWKCPATWTDEGWVHAIRAPLDDVLDFLARALWVGATSPLVNRASDFEPTLVVGGAPRQEAA